MPRRRPKSRAATRAGGNDPGILALRTDYDVVYAPRALRDLEGIAAYLSERNPNGAVKVLSAIKSSIHTSNFFPQIGRIIDNADRRRVPVLAIPM